MRPRSKTTTDPASGGKRTLTPIFHSCTEAGDTTPAATGRNSKAPGPCNPRGSRRLPQRLRRGAGMLGPAPSRQGAPGVAAVHSRQKKAARCPRG
ncbi:hypothetical protein NDU88_005653 [Pleurodeles waltl]|uniref:Uncharacterized protein n=1 Tax=Pleurodeles waltl TaxID=8319 RepID=A0AAV7TB28_PLEWA|nr:hypothetical protein NDU88_005653 [Pleurodeles waltl]